MKVCTKCHIEKEESEFYKTIRRQSCWCKECYRVRKRRWYKKNKIKAIAYLKDYQIKNKQKVLSWAKKWKLENKEKARAAQYNSVKKRHEYYKGKARQYAKTSREVISNEYIKRLLIHGDGIHKELLKTNPELIDIKRNIIKIKRLCNKQSQQM